MEAAYSSAWSLTTRAKSLNLLATPAGLEPATYCLEGSCSIQLSYGAIPSQARVSMGPGADAIELEVV